MPFRWPLPWSWYKLQRHYWHTGHSASVMTCLNTAHDSYLVQWFETLNRHIVLLQLNCGIINTRTGLHQWPSGNTLELVDGRCQVQTSVALVDLAVRSFPWLSPKLGSLERHPRRALPQQAKVPQADNWPHLYNYNYSWTITFTVHFSWTSFSQ